MILKILITLTYAQQVIIGLKFEDVETIVEVDDNLMFTNKFCTEKPNSTQIYFSSLNKGQPSLDFLSPDFLHSCKIIKTVSVTVCKIKSLDQDTFKYSVNLEIVSFYCNQISYISDASQKTFLNLYKSWFSYC